LNEIQTGVEGFNIPIQESRSGNSKGFDVTKTLVRSVALSIPAIRNRYDSIIGQIKDLQEKLELAKAECRELRADNATLTRERELLRGEVAHLKQQVGQSFARVLGKLSTMEYAIDSKLEHLKVGDSEAQGFDSTSTKLYLDLLEKALVGLLYRDKPLQVGSSDDFNPDLREIGWDWPSEAVTMIGRARMANLRFLCEKVIKQNIPGDFIETGVWRGGACIYMRAICRAYLQNDRKIWVADSFEGLPKPDAEKYPADKGDPHWTLKELAVSIETVKQNFEKFGLLDDQVHFLKGWFKDTLPVAPIKRLAILRLDGDLYESTMDALNALYDKVSENGFVIVDDYLLETCKKAIIDFRYERKIEAPLIEVDGAAVYWQK
jgi:O-methyltransferase/8-demethyl-8-(2,3-dimethoxy-alpha-L-rhamnosyl)tetracenomycin-C 4'-O-methyltransferase